MSIQIVYNGDSKWNGTGWETFKAIKENYNGHDVFQASDSKYQYLIILHTERGTILYRQCSMTIQEAEKKLGCKIREK